MATGQILCAFATRQRKGSESLAWSDRWSLLRRRVAGIFASGKTALPACKHRGLHRYLTPQAEHGRLVPRALSCSAPPRRYGVLYGHRPALLGNVVLLAAPPRRARGPPQDGQAVQLGNSPTGSARSRGQRRSARAVSPRDAQGADRDRGSEPVRLRRPGPPVDAGPGRAERARPSRRASCVAPSVSPPRRTATGLGRRVSLRTREARGQGAAWTSGRRAPQEPVRAASGASSRLHRPPGQPGPRFWRQAPRRA